MNQPGGIGRIVQVHEDDHGVRQYSVKYVVDSRTEHHLEEKYVHAHEFAVSKFRDRRLLLGRCRRCGSLRTDCGSCENDIPIVGMMMENGIPNTAIPPQQKRRKSKDIIMEKKDSDMENDDTDDSIEGLAIHSDAYYQRYYQKFKRFEKRAKLYGLDEMSNQSSSCSDSRNEDENNTGESSDDSSSLFLQSLALSQSVRRNRPHLRRRNVRAILDESDSHSSSNSSSTTSSLDESIDENHQDDRVESNNVWREGGVLAATAALTASPRKPTKRQRSSTFQIQALERDSNDATLPQPLFGNVNDSSVTNETTDIDAASESPRQPVVSTNQIDPINPDFLQPEGEADELPADIQDQTKNLSYPELMPFFDEIVQRLEMNEIPNRKIQVMQLEREWKKASNETEKRELLRKRYEGNMYH
jgi:hypothetical protein